MAKIQKAPLNRLAIVNIIAYGRSINSLIDVSEVPTTDFKSHYETFKSTLEDLNNSFMRVSYSDLTKQLQVIGKKRNNIRSSIISIIDINKYHKDNTIQEAALKLINIINNYRLIYKLSYFLQTPMIEDFINTLSLDIYKEAIEKLKLTEWINYLTEINKEFIQIKENRTEGIANKKLAISTMDAKKLFVEANDDLIIRINSLANVQGEKSYIKLIASWNVLIDEIRINLSLKFGTGKVGKPANDIHYKENPTSGPEPDTGGDYHPVIE